MSMESRLWGVLRNCAKSVTITDGNQVIHFRKLGDCAKFFENYHGLKAGCGKLLLSKHAEYIEGWKIFYEGLTK